MPATRRVLFVNRFYWPDHSATAQMLTDLAGGLAARGWSVTVVASRLRYDGGEPLPPRETHAGVTIERVATTQFGRGSLAGRAMDYASFYLAASLAAVRLLARGDIVVAKTDPPLLQVPLAAVARLRGARLINWMQDVYPELAVALGVDALRGIPARLLSALRRRALRSAARTVVIGSRMREVVAAAGAPADSIAEIHNWGDDAVLASPADGSLLRAEWGFAPDRLTVAYSGNLGRAHDLETMLEAARILAAEAAPVDFLFVGGGALVERLEAAGLPNLHRRPYQPREDLPRSLAVADLHWLSLRAELEGLIVPSKFYGAASSARPIVFIGALDGEVAQLVRRHDCGWAFTAGDAEGVAAMLRALAADRSRLAEPGANARRMVRAHFTREHSVEAWDALLRQVCAMDVE